MTRTEAYLALNLIPNIGPVRVRKLLQAFSSPERILSASAKEIRSVEGFGEDLTAALVGWQNTCDLTRELRRIQEENLTILTQEDENYPALLKELYDPPIVLYVRGEITARDRHAIAIVGSRRATNYGMTIAKKLGFQLAYAGYTVVSGLARGVDTAAHEGALASTGRTIAVIGAGHGKLYPPENQGLADRIAQQGAVVSQFPVDTPPDKQTFPTRNRVVSGWSSGVVVVEAPLRSGSLITAGQALEQNRTVYAVPGNIDRPTSQGCNRLIQEGAKLIMDGSDVIDDLLTLFPTQPKAAQAPATSTPSVRLTNEESAVYSSLGDKEAHINDLAQELGLALPALNVTLMKLEMKRLIKALPGKYYTKLV